MNKVFIFTTPLLWFFFPIILFAQEKANMSNSDKQRKVEATRDNFSVVSKDGFTLGYDLSRVEGDASIAFFDSTGIIINLNGFPYSLIATPEFNPLKLPENLQKRLPKIKIIVIRSPFISEEQQTKKFSLIPPWLEGITGLEYLMLDHVKVKDLFFLQNHPIKHIVLNQVIVEDKELFLSSISNLTRVEYLAHNFLFTPKELLNIKTDLPHLEVLMVSDYNRKRENGEIKIQ